MAAICAWCEKKTQFGSSYTHHRGVAGGRWKKRAPKTRRIFKVNLQRVTIEESGFEMSIRLCAKCIKRIKKDVVDGKKPFLNLAHLKKPEASSKAVVPAVAVASA